MSKIWQKIFFSFLVCGLILGIASAVRSYLADFAEFKIKEVVVVNEKAEPVQNLEDFFSLPDDLNLFSLDMERIAQDIQARHPELAGVSMRKQFPHKLLIVVKQRRPVAIVVVRDIYLVDAEGFILPFKAINFALPKIVGVEPNQIHLYTKSPSLRLNRALELLAELKKVKIYPEHKDLQINVREYQDLVFFLENGIEVRMGEGDWARKCVLLKGILAQLKASGTTPEYIDMRFDSPVVKP